ncbi:MAG: hypothetical protein AB7P02_22965 [Alphaproteobacteria bacterium]
MAEAKPWGWLAADDATLLRKTFRDLVQHRHVPEGLAVIEEYRTRQPEHPMVRWLAAWGPAVARDWTAGFPPASFDPAAEAAPIGDAELEIVVWFAACPEGMTGGKLGGPAGSAEAYMALVRDCFATARRAAPAIRTVLLTDERTVVPDDVGADAVRRSAVAPEHLMFERMRAYRGHLAATGRAGIVFVDPDVLVCRSPALAFDRPHSLGLTWRSDPQTMPVNGGVIFARRTPGALWLLDRALGCYAAMADDPVLGPAFARLNGLPLRAWHGDQVALAAMTGWRRFASQAPAPRTFGAGTTIALLPDDPFNFAVEQGATIDDAALRRRVLVHFKGAAKALAPSLAASLLGRQTVDGGRPER